MVQGMLCPLHAFYHFKDSAHLSVSCLANEPELCCSQKLFVSPQNKTPVAAHSPPMLSKQLDGHEFPLLADPNQAASLGKASYPSLEIMTFDPTILLGFGSSNGNHS